MKPEISIGQWWETRDGSRALVITISNQVKGSTSNRKQPVACLDINGQVYFYTTAGQYYRDNESPEDLVTLLPDECDGFDWKPEPKWRDARPEDVQHPSKMARFRLTGTVNWEQERLLIGTIFRCDGKRLWVTDAGQHYGDCQVQEDQ